MRRRLTPPAALFLALAVVVLSATALAPGAPSLGAQTPVWDGYVTTPDGVRLYHRIVGDGPEVVLVPVATFHGTRLDALANDRRRIVLFDPRHRGRSGRGDLASVSLDRQIADVEAVRGAVGAERVDLIGWSGLGMELWAYALRHPERVRRIVQLAPIPPRQEPWIGRMVADRAVRLDSAALEDFGARVAAGAFTDDPEGRCQESNRIEWAATFADPARVDEAPDVCKLPNEWGQNLGPYFDALLGSFGAYDWRPSLDSVPVPRLVIHGAQDNIPLEGNMEWVEGRPEARILVVEGAGHWPHYERPEEVLRAIDAFLGGEWPAGSVSGVEGGGPPRLRR